MYVATVDTSLENSSLPKQDYKGNYVARSRGVEYVPDVFVILWQEKQPRYKLEVGQKVLFRDFEHGARKRRDTIHVNDFVALATKYDGDLSEVLQTRCKQALSQVEGDISTLFIYDPSQQSRPYHALILTGSNNSLGAILISRFKPESFGIYDESSNDELKPVSWKFLSFEDFKQKFPEGQHKIRYGFVGYEKVMLTLPVEGLVVEPTSPDVLVPSFIPKQALEFLVMNAPQLRK